MEDIHNLHSSQNSDHQVEVKVEGLKTLPGICGEVMRILRHASNEELEEFNKTSESKKYINQSVEDSYISTFDCSSYYKDTYEGKGNKSNSFTREILDLDTKNYLENRRKHSPEKDKK